MTSSNIPKWLRSNYNVICDVCGRKRKRSEVKNAYGTGDLPVVISCIDGCADIRHPLNSPPPLIFDGQPVKDARPEATDVFISISTGIQTWGSFTRNMVWGGFNVPNDAFNMDGIWDWSTFGGNNSISL